MLESLKKIAAEYLNRKTDKQINDALSEATVVDSNIENLIVNDDELEIEIRDVVNSTESDTSPEVNQDQLDGEVVEGFPLGTESAIDIVNFEKLHGGRTKWDERFFGRLYFRTSDEWPYEGSGLIIGYINELDEKILVDIVWVDIGEKGQTHILVTGDLINEKPNEIERRQQLIKERISELAEKYPDKQMRVLGWYHDHPLADGAFGNTEPTAPNPGIGDLKANEQIYSSYTHPDKPLMVIGQKNPNATISIAVWRPENSTGSRVIYQPGILVTGQQEWQLYWPVPDNGQTIYDADALEEVELPDS